ncbi:MAG: DUF5667 domain-containing protein [Candidatus Aenigmarchaeota archaeon]|nr:DUF5667 domain-containing protein [Candidatus Aenigmarchaeota archaeon]
MKHLAVFLVFVLASSALAQSTDNVGILPDSPFYFLKEFSWSLKKAFSADKVSVEAEYGSEKLREAYALKDSGKEKAVEKALNNYLKSRERLSKMMAEMEKNERSEAIASKIIEQNIEHKRIFFEIVQKNPSLESKTPDALRSIDNNFVIAVQKADVSKIVENADERKIDELMASVKAACSIAESQECFQAANELANARKEKTRTRDEGKPVEIEKEVIITETKVGKTPDTKPQIKETPLVVTDTAYIPSVKCVVTGCSGQICSESEVMSTCDFRPEYECYKYAVCEVRDDGRCGWTKTPEFEKCLGIKAAAKE